MKNDLSNEYLNNLNDSLSEKIALNEYLHYNEIILVRNTYMNLYNSFLTEHNKSEIIPNSENNVFGHIFSISAHFFNEFMNNIILSQYDSAHYSARRIVENYIILVFLLKNRDCVSDFFNQIVVNKYKKLKHNNQLKPRLTKKELKVVEEEYEILRQEVLTFFSINEPLTTKQQRKVKSILENDYFFAYKKIGFGERINLRKIANQVGLEREYSSFGISSNRVHSNNIFEYRMILSSNYNEEVYLAITFYDYILRFTDVLSDYYTWLDFSEMNKVLSLLDLAITRIEKLPIKV